LHDLRKMSRGHIHGYIVCKSDRISGAIVSMRKISQEPTAIRGLPPKEFVRKYCCLVPRDLLSDKAIEARLLVYLWKLPTVSKGIGIPGNVDIHPKFILEVSFTHQDLTN
jgi:hypothetical protein